MDELEQAARRVLERSSCRVAPHHRNDPAWRDEECLACIIRGLLQRPVGMQAIGTAPARRSDPSTSTEAVRKLTSRNAVGKLALAFYKARVVYGWDGLTTEAAVRLAGLESLSCPWKRVSDLKAAGIIEPTGETAPARSGADQQILTMTDHGVAETRRVFPTETAEMGATGA